MKTILFNELGQIRNGWWALLFIICVVLTGFAYTPISRMLEGVAYAEPLRQALTILFLLFATWICTRLRKESLSSIGLKINSIWLSQLFVGVMMGGLMVCLTILPIWGMGGLEFQFNSDWVVSSLTYALLLFILGAAFEEILHRGFLFQRLIAGIGFWPTQIIISSIFAIGHWTNPEVSAENLWIVSLELGLASIVFGLAYYKTKSLALPIGLHLGWNWIQGSVFGFQVSGHEKVGIFEPILLSDATWLTGGSFGIEGSVFSIVVEIIAIAGIVYWFQRRPSEELNSPKAAIAN